MDLSRCLRFPIRGGARFAKAAGEFAQAGRGEPEAENYSERLVDNINHDLLVNMARSLPVEAYFLAFVSGSIVTNRLGKAQTYWRRIETLFELEKITRDLSAQYGRRIVEDTVSRIKKMIISSLLCDRTTIGPAILLFRIMKPTDQMLSFENYRSVEAFMQAFSGLSRDCDESVREILVDSHLV
jgi:hypothetical protein